MFDLEPIDEVKMWVFEETLPSGEKLTDVINQTNVFIVFPNSYPRFVILFHSLKMLIFFLLINRKMLNTYLELSLGAMLLLTLISKMQVTSSSLSYQKRTNLEKQNSQLTNCNV